MWVEILVLGVEVLVIFLLFIHFRKIDSHTSVLKDHFEKLSETVEEIDRHLREHEDEMDDHLNEHETGMDQHIMELENHTKRIEENVNRLCTCSNLTEDSEDSR